MRILVIQPRRLGDVLLVTPLLRALKTQIVDASLHLCVEPAYAPAVQANPHVDALLPAHGLWPPLAVRLRRGRYDAVIDTLGTPRTARLTWLARARVRIGVRRPWRALFYTHGLPRPATPRYSALDKLAYALPLGVRSDDWRTELPVTATDRDAAERLLAAIGARARGPLVGFSPVSRRADKRWPAERYAAICDRWATAHGWRFLPLCGPGEEAQVAAVVRHASRPEAHLLACPVVPFGVLRPLLERCDCYFGNDNAIRHVAIAAGVPSAGIFAHPNPVCWTPPSSLQHLTAGGQRPIDTVSVEEVDAMLARLQPHLTPGPGGRSPADGGR
jgi:ADP-heptose:LPS heptosyltransferase